MPNWDRRAQLFGSAHTGEEVVVAAAEPNITGQTQITASSVEPAADSDDGASDHGASSSSSGASGGATPEASSSDKGKEKRKEKMATVEDASDEEDE